jgi:flagella basal body P-ring formation protein FlgA
MRFRIRFMLAAAVCALVPAAACAAAPAPRTLAVELRADVQVAGGAVALGDVALLDANDPGAARLAAVRLGTTPRVGYVERFTRAQIAQAVRRQSDVAAIAWSGAESVVVRGQSHEVGADALASAAIDAVRAEFGVANPGLEVRLAAQPAPLEVPNGRLELRARRVSGTVLAKRMAQWVDVLVDGAVYRSAVVQLAVSQQRRVYVARRALEQGAWAGPADFTVSDANAAGLAAVAVGPALEPFRLRAALKEGQVLAAGAMLNEGKILRGDSVRIIVRNGQIGIEAGAVALAEAGPGQQLAVRPNGGGDPLTGRVSQAGTVIIE